MVSNSSLLGIDNSGPTTSELDEDDKLLGSMELPGAEVLILEKYPSPCLWGGKKINYRWCHLCEEKKGKKGKMWKKKEEKGNKKAKTESIRVKYLHGGGELMIKGCGRSKYPHNAGGGNFNVLEGNKGRHVNLWPGVEEEASPALLQSAPFSYLAHIQEELRKNPTRKFVAAIKVIFCPGVDKK
jgi:hypothetical protein